MTQIASVANVEIVIVGVILVQEKNAQIVPYSSETRLKACGYRSMASSDGVPQNVGFPGFFGE